MSDLKVYPYFTKTCYPIYCLWNLNVTQGNVCAFPKRQRSRSRVSSASSRQGTIA